MMQGAELVTIMSVKQKASWQAFSNYFQIITSRLALDCERHQHLKNNVVRALDSLSFCDFDFGETTGGRVYSCDTALVRLPSTSLLEFVLVGARTARTIETILAAFGSYGLQAQLTPQPYPLVPPKISFTGDFEVIQHVCDELGIAVATQPPSWQILWFASSVADYLAQCTFDELLESAAAREDFDVISLRFSDRANRSSDSTYRLTTYYGEYGRPRHFLWKNQCCAQVDRDWARYAVLAGQNKNVLVYDADHNLLLVPVLTPLPRIYSRAMALCSGMAPPIISLDADQGFLFLEYTNVPQLFAETLARKLGQHLKLIRGEYERSD